MPELCGRRFAADLNTLLIEQRDFSWGTSSRSGQLVHGGLRYMKQGDFTLTYKSVKERGRLLVELPGLVKSSGLMMAIYKESWVRRADRAERIICI